MLLVVGHLPAGLVEAAAVVYAQMPRPRAILAVGARAISPLPEPDVSVSLDQNALVEGVARLRAAFAAGAWSPDANAFAVEVIEPEDDADASVAVDHASMVHGDGEGASGGEENDDDGSAHGSMDHGQGDDESSDGEDTGESGHEGMDHSGSNGQMDHSGMDHGDMDHGGMDHGDMGFMSMVAMTKDMPRDRDGLPMERVEAPFGPLFPGLPAGLCVTFTLDGDVVVMTTASAEPVRGAMPEALAGPAATFPDRLARQQRLAPTAYWLLGRAALDRVAGVDLAASVRRAYAAELERARAVSHLSWLAEFAGLLGDRWLRDRATDLQSRTLRVDDNDMAAIRRLRGDAASLVAGYDRLRMIRWRLSGLAVLDADDSLPGPVGRAAGDANDARASDPVYEALGFAPIARNEGDAFARFRLLLDEVMQSLDLILAAGTMTSGSPPLPVGLSGSGSATLETPRGTATLALTVEDGEVSKAELTTPSPRLVEVIPAVTKEAEVADALIGVASLDLSPWEIVG